MHSCSQWTPELYTLRHLPGYDTASKPNPVAGEDVWLLEGAVQALHELISCPLWADSQIAIASRTNKAAWARALLQSFMLPREGGGSTRLSEIVSFAEIYTGSKVRHLERLREQSGLSFDQMIFFDDALGGKFGNCEAVAKLGVFSVHTPAGLTSERWSQGLRTYSKLRSTGATTAQVLKAGRSSRPSPAMPPRSDPAQPPTEGTIKKFFPEKGYGFVSPKGGGSDIFFHLSVVQGTVGISPGLAVAFTLGTNKRGQPECSSLRALVPTVRIRCFSMNQPFAGLVAHGHKLLETRNGTMFVGTEGERMLLHVGRRTYPDGGKHLDIMRRAGVSEEEILRLTSLPDGFSRGQAVAIVEVCALISLTVTNASHELLLSCCLQLGETTLLPREERCTHAVEHQACAYGDDSDL